MDKPTKNSDDAQAGRAKIISEEAQKEQEKIQLNKDSSARYAKFVQKLNRVSDRDIKAALGS